MKITQSILFSESSRRVNLRRSGSGLAGVGTPQIIAAHGTDARFVEGACHVSAQGRSYIFFERGGTLFSVCVETAGELPVEAGVPSAVVAVMSVAGGVVVMFRGEPPRRYVLDKEENGAETAWRRSPLFVEGPYVIVRRDLSQETATVQPVALKGTYDARSARLTAADAESVCRRACEAYEALADSAAAAHRFVQPVMARYRLYGEGSELVYESAPVLVAPASGPQMLSAQFTVASPFSATSALSLEASTFGLELVRAVPVSDAERELVSRVELVVSPQFHPVDATLQGTCRFKGRSDSVLSFDCLLPGVNPYGRPGEAGGFVRELSVGVLALLSGESDASASSSPVMRRYDSPVPSFEAHTVALRRIRKAAAEAAAPGASHSAAPEHEISAPHTFTAEAGAVNGPAVVWAGLSSVPFGGYRMSEFAIAAASVQGGGPVAALVTMADGSTVASSVTLSGVSLSALSPLLLYPSGRAVSLTLIAEGMRQTYPLTPTPDGRWAFWLAPDARPHMPEASQAPFVVPASAPAPRSFPGYVAVASAAEPLRPLCGVDSTVGRATAVAAAPRGGLTREFARGSFYVMGSGGTDGVAVSASMSSVVVSHIDSRPVAGPAAVAVADGGLCLLAGREIVSVAGSKATALFSLDGLIPEGHLASGLGWSPQFRELWVASEKPATVMSAQSVQSASGSAGPGGVESVGPVTVVFGFDGSPAYRRTDFTPLMFLHTPAGTVAVDSAGCTRRLAVEKDRLLSVRLDACLPVSQSAASAGRWMRRTLAVPLSCPSRLSGSIALAGLNFADIGRPSDALPSGLPLGSVPVGGVVAHPVMVPFMLPHLHAVLLTVELTASSPRKLCILPWTQQL